MVRTELGCKLLGFPLILIISLFLADLLVFFFGLNGRLSGYPDDIFVVELKPCKTF